MCHNAFWAAMSVSARPFSSSFTDCMHDWANKLAVKANLYAVGEGPSAMARTAKFGTCNVNPVRLCVSLWWIV